MTFPLRCFYSPIGNSTSLDPTLTGISRFGRFFHHFTLRRPEGILDSPSSLPPNFAAIHGPGEQVVSISPDRTSVLVSWTHATAAH
jgi:hypothetical protein